MKKLMSVIGLLAIVLLGSPLNSTAQSADERFFAETNRTVRGKFLAYWQANGGLPQQGYPISEELQETSPLNGKSYTVQYFERALFELHPENAGTPYEVLLAQLGTLRYQQKYANGAGGQTTSSDNPRRFEQTGKTVGGVFRTYWEQHGGLAQQGYPISDEFDERSELDGKTYRVQYFERAVFELHPELPSPNNVLLTQLGTFRLRDKATPPTAAPQPTQPPAPAPTATPTGKPALSIVEYNSYLIYSGGYNPTPAYRYFYAILKNNGNAPATDINVTLNLINDGKTLAAEDSPSLPYTN